MQDTTALPDQAYDPRARSADRSRWMALLVLCAGMLMIVLDVTIVNVALPSIQASLGFSQAGLAWVINAYLITSPSPWPRFGPATDPSVAAPSHPAWSRVRRGRSPV